MLRRTVLLAVAVLLAFPIARQAQAEAVPGTFGFAIDVDGEGFFLNPTLKTVTIKSVVPGRPAATAGMKPGDQVVEVEGRLVSGAKARELQPLMKKNVGESLALRLRKPSGDLYAVSLVAAPKDQ
jgi:C-terminal processing protease CtpA/Prc